MHRHRRRLRLPVPECRDIAAPGLQDEVVAARDRQLLARAQHMVIGIAAAGDPQGTGLDPQPSPPRGHEVLRISHQYMFHHGLLDVLQLPVNHRRHPVPCRMRIEPSIDA
jgi:hypothetical protein